MSDKIKLTHDEYVKIIQTDKDYVNEQLSLWEGKLEEAQTKVNYWKSQSEAILTVSSRVIFGGNSSFKI